MAQPPEPREPAVPGTTESTEELIARRGSPVISSEGRQIGEIEEIFEDAATGAPEWIGLGTGVLYRRRVLVPLRDAAVDADGIHTVRYTKDVVTGAPDVELADDEFLSPDSERALAGYYGLPGPPAQSVPRLRIRRYVDDKAAEPPEDATPAHPL
jgi:hypothetical protein